MSIRFSSLDTDFQVPNPEKTKNWIEQVIRNHHMLPGRISYCFCSDEHIHKVNVDFLNHDTYTDIITFDYVQGNLVSGDILISVDRVGENARSFSVPFEQELCRVIIHGVLHLLGFKDKSNVDAATMRMKEEESLQLLIEM